MEIIRNRKFWTVLAIIIFVSVELSAVQYSGNYGNGLSKTYYVLGDRSKFITSNEISALDGLVRTPAGVLRYIPVVVDNTQNQSTQVPFDLEVKIDSYALRPLE